MASKYGYNGEWFAGAHRNEHTFKPREGLTELQLEFIDWLLDPAKSGTQKQWAEDHGVSERALHFWKKDKRFTDEWEKRAAEAYGGMERLQSVLDKLYTVATEAEGDKAVKAIQLYLQYVDRYTPTKKIVREGTHVRDLTDEELARLGENVILLRKEAADG